MADAFDDEAEPTISIGEYLEGVEEQELVSCLLLILDFCSFGIYVESLLQNLVLC